MKIPRPLYIVRELKTMALATQCMSFTPAIKVPVFNACSCPKVSVFSIQYMRWKLEAEIPVPQYSFEGREQWVHSQYMCWELGAKILGITYMS